MKLLKLPVPTEDEVQRAVAGMLQLFPRARSAAPEKMELAEDRS